MIVAITVSGVLLSPAAFGGAPSWFSPMFVGVTGLLGIAWAALVGTYQVLQPASLRPVSVPILLFVGVLVWSIVQATVPVSPDLSNEAWMLPNSWNTATTDSFFSINPQNTLEGVTRLAAYGLVFILFFQFGADEHRALKILSAVVGFGTAYALYGVFTELFDWNSVLWYERNFEQGNLSSTFPNRNAFASYAVFCLLCAFALLFRRRIRASDLTGHWKFRASPIFRFFVIRNGWVVLSSLILFLAILMTHSRAGLVTALLAIFIFFVLEVRTSIYRRAALMGATTVAALFMVLFLAMGSETSSRFAKLSGAGAERLEIYRLALTKAQETPWTGTGLGTFADVFTSVRSKSLRPSIDFAHNSYLENMLEIGLPAAACLYLSLTLIFFRLVRGQNQKTAKGPYPALGISIMIAAAFHAAFDHAVQFPAVLITFSAVLGLIVGQVTISRTVPSAEIAGTVSRRRSERDT